MNEENIVLARNTENAPICKYSSQTVAFSHYNNLSAQLPISPKTGQLVSGGIMEQAKQCFDNIKAIVESVDQSLNDTIRITIFLKNIKDIETVDNIYKSFFISYLPSRTVIAVNELPFGALIQVEAIISNGVGTIPNAPQANNLIKLTNNTENAPMNQLSNQTVAFSHYNNISAQLPIDPLTGRLVPGGMKEQTVQSLKNIKAILTSIDVPLDDIVKVNIFITDINDISIVDDVYHTFFPDSGIARYLNYLPARTVVEVKDLPMGALIQIEVVVSHGDGTPPQEIEDRHALVIEANNTKHAPIDLECTQVVAFSHYNHISAQLPIHNESGEIVDEGIEAQTVQCFKNIKAIIESVNHVVNDVVKLNVFLKNLSDLDTFNKIYEEFFKGELPARRVIGVENLMNDALVQIDVVVGNAEGTPSNS